MQPSLKDNSDKTRFESALSTWILRDAPDFATALALLQNAGIANVELSGTGSKLFSAWEKEPENVAARIGQAGVNISSLHCPADARLHLDSVDGALRKESVNKSIDCLNRMGESHVPVMVLHPGDAGPGENANEVNVEESEPPSERIRALRESLKQLVGAAGDFDIRLAVENASKSPGPLASMRGLLEAIEGMGEHVGLCFDTGHAILAGYDPFEELEVASESGKLFSLHLHDVDGRGNDHLLPGEGDFDMPGFMKKLDQLAPAALRVLELKPLARNLVGRLSEASDVCKLWNQ